MTKKYPYHGAHVWLINDLHDKNWKPHIGIKDQSSCEISKKNTGYQELMCLDCKTQLEQVQTTGDLEDDTKKHLALRIRKNVNQKEKKYNRH